jgi:tetratricopeptide (TPR) repeat protein
MSMPITGKMRNYIFIALLSMVAICLIIEFSIAAAQDKAYRLNYQNYQKATQLMQAQKFAEAQESLAGLDQDSQAMWLVVYNLAICAQKTGDLQAAVELMQKVRDIRPVILMDQGYLERYGEILYESGDYERSRLYLLESLKYPKDAALVQAANQYLAGITAKQQGGR